MHVGVGGWVFLVLSLLFFLQQGLLEYVQPSWASRVQPKVGGLNLGAFGSNVAPRPAESVVGAVGDSPQSVQFCLLCYFLFRLLKKNKLKEFMPAS